MIKSAYLEHKNKNTTLAIEKISITHYFGQYGDSHVAIIFIDVLDALNMKLVSDSVYPDKFYYKAGRISVYNDNKYYTLREAYNSNLLTKDQMEDLYNKNTLLNKEMEKNK